MEWGSQIKWRTGIAAQCERTRLRRFLTVILLFLALLAPFSEDDDDEEDDEPVVKKVEIVP